MSLSDVAARPARMAWRSWLVAGSLVLSACAAAPPATDRSCASPALAPQTLDRLYVGRARPDGGEVSDDEFRRFLADVVTPRFPQGLTVVHASGQWRSNDGRIVAERSAILHLVHAGTPAERQHVADIVADYKHRFRQEAVLRVSQPACVSF
jgi:hypothetical protein